MCTHTNTHKTTGGYIVITLDQFPGVRCKQIIVHFSAQQEQDTELEEWNKVRTIMPRTTTENIKVVLNERGRENGLEKEKDTMFQTQSKECRWEKRSRQRGIRNPNGTVSEKGRK